MMSRTQTLPWSYCLMLCCFLLLKEVNGNLARKTLEKELLHNSIRYLREQLLVCLKATDGVRGKRKADFDSTSHWMSELELQMDIDILQNSHTYLMDRVLHCRRRLGHAKTTKVDPVVHVDAILKSKVEKYLPQTAKLQDTRPVNDVPAISSDQQGAQGIPEVPVVPEVAPTTTGASTTVTSTVLSTTTTTEPTTPFPKTEFVLDGRSVTCEKFSVHGTSFQCVNLRVNEDERLPNKDFCPPTYEPGRWRPVSDMSSRTRDVLDLLNLCAILGQNLMVPGYSKDVSVVWGCDEIRPRLSWQNGHWGHYVDDNGYLHDLMCVYSADIKWPKDRP